MKRIAHLCLAGALMVVLGASLSVAQDSSDDLGKYARQQKKQKESAPAPAKVFDNDNLPTSEHISVVGSESKSSSSDASTAATGTDSSNPSSDQTVTGNDKKPAAVEPGQSAVDRQEAFADWQSKIKQQKDALDLATRELDVVKREYALRAATVASDVGYRLRNSAQWDKEDKQYKEQIAAKQRAVDSAKQKLDGLQEDARKAGVPNKMRE